MANKVSVDLDMNVQGYVQGITTATQSTEKYETETRKVADAQVNLMKELKAAKREVQNLAAGYARLDSEAKKSSFGREMARQLEEAKQKAAEFIDLQGDLNQELKNLASDTRTFDTLKEGVDVFANATSSAIGLVAQFTGEESDAQKAVVAFTTAQSILNTLTAVGNALQKQSNTMLAIGKVQTLAATAATKMKTAAEGQGVVTTKAATAAQALFNKVAMANPYVLLAAAIITVVGALAAFISFTNKSAAAEKAEAKVAEEQKAAKDAYYNTYNQKLTETMSNYSKLQTEWKNLKSEGEKNQWIKDNEEAFHSLGYEINNTADAEKFFVDNEQAVIESFNARAEAAAYAAQQVEIFNQALEGTPKAGEKLSTREAAKYGIGEQGHEVTTHWFDDNEITLTKADEKKIREARLQEARQTSKELGEERINAEKKTAEAEAKVGVKTYNKVKKQKLKKTKTTTEVEVKIEKNSLAESEAELKKLEEIRSKMSIDNPNLPKIKKDIENLKKTIQEKKIKLGLELPKTSVDTLSEYEKTLRKIQEEAKADYISEWLKNPNSEKLDELYNKWMKAKEAVDQYNAAVELQEKGITVTGDKDIKPIMDGNVEKSIKGYSDAISKLQEKITSTDFSKMENGDEQFQRYIERIQELKAELEPMQKQMEEAMLTPLEKAEKKLQETADNITSVGNAVQAAGDLFSALGEVSDDEGLKTAGIVAKAVATVALSFAQALTTAKTWVDWLAFGITGLTTMVSMIGQIKSVTSGGYAQGGIVPGSSYSGDRLMANVNSGEMILNKRQQQNLFNMLDQGAMPTSGGTNVTVTGVIRGTDIMLVQKNANKVLRKTGTSINF